MQCSQVLPKTMRHLGLEHIPIRPDPLASRPNPMYCKPRISLSPGPLCLWSDPPVGGGRGGYGPVVSRWPVWPGPLSPDGSQFLCLLLGTSNPRNTFMVTNKQTLYKNLLLTVNVILAVYKKTLFPVLFSHFSPSFSPGEFKTGLILPSEIVFLN